jgi:hypothetical protein
MIQVDDRLPSMFPCSQSTHTHSTPVLASTLETLAPGTICHMPYAFRPSLKATLSLLDACIVPINLRESDDGGGLTGNDRRLADTARRPVVLAAIGLMVINNPSAGGCKWGALREGLD